MLSLLNIQTKKKYKKSIKKVYLIKTKLLVFLKALLFFKYHKKSIAC